MRGLDISRVCALGDDRVGRNRSMLKSRPRLEELEGRALMAVDPLTNGTIIAYQTTQGSVFSHNAWAPLSGAVAQFTDAVPTPGATFAASINWGDGAVSPADKVTGGGTTTLTVFGTHMYTTAEGNVTATVSIIQTGPGPGPFPVYSATSTDPGSHFGFVANNNILTGSVGFSAAHGTTFSGQIATFNNANIYTYAGPNPNDGSFLFSASVNWGDGSLSQPVAVSQPGGPGTPIIIKGSHLYAAAGRYLVTVAIVENPFTSPTHPVFYAQASVMVS